MLVLTFVSLHSLGAHAEATISSTATGPHIRVSLLSENKQLQPGVNWLGVFLDPEPDWHTYWRNPGDSGEPPTINWELPAGFIAGDIQWPLPKAIPVAHLVNYGYEGQTLLMVPVEVPTRSVGQQALTVTANLTWLVCKEDCIPGDAQLSKTFSITEVATPSADAALFAETRTKLPVDVVVTAQHEVTDTTVAFSFASDDINQDWKVFPFRGDLLQHNAAQSINVQDGQVIVAIPKSEYLSDAPDELDLLVTDGNAGFRVRSSLQAAQVTLAKQPNQSLLVMVLFAFLGGLILNLMPCVLPILSLKALSLSDTEAHPGGLQKWAYAIGVFAMFNVIALIIISLKSGGNAVGWGFQMQNPWVVVALIFLFAFIALSLLDAVPNTGRFAGLGESLTRGDSAGAHFFTGVLAVVVASPCTAPFMAAAVGIAMVSQAAVTLLIFNALALGFALPLVLLQMSSTVRGWLPRPGAWMNHLKHLLAFPMLATVAWLLWVLAGQTSSMTQFGVMLSLVAFSMLLWISSISRGAWQTVALVLGGLCVIWPLTTLTPATSSEQMAGKTTFSVAALQALRADNQVVLVNMTADWCITCKVNEQTALGTSTVQQMLADEDIHYLVGDWTNKNSEILEFLKSYERSGVPLYIVYAGTKSHEVLPQLLTPNMVIEAIQRAKEAI